MTKLDASSIVTLAGVNLVIASPDCQPFSVPGNQHGFEDLRSSSFSHCLRVIRSIHDLTQQPLTYVVENVPGHNLSKAGSLIAENAAMRMKV